ncbi:LOW QUALITY PROTEIN: hypothetical protein Cgig2_030847 [Carnegiea gigantea]|uniref:Reverse transcriptase n=1 Tax=Carnegiea gigantea TaxID=171969 RepID=A0A9Q1GIB8_9CARY|nr:LOW QUALITY PROTEIN: hypothetical protein Cgig2_030847 [Carnegiea gigantea]
MDKCELTEIRSFGTYYSWSNKTIWSRIDRALHNQYWHTTFDFTHVMYMANSLSDHTPLCLQFLATPKTRPSFKYCEICASNFSKIVSSAFPTPESASTVSLTVTYLSSLRPKLSKLYRDNFKDLRQQVETARQRLTTYIDILSSSISLIKQQCKFEWIGYGNDSTRLFFAKAKQRKLVSYTYSLMDEEGHLVEGFDQLERIVKHFWQGLLGPQIVSQSPIVNDIILIGPLLTQEQQVSLCQPFSDQNIKEAIFSIPNLKSVGPDGYSSSFFKQAWTIIGSMISAAVKDFFRIGHMPNSIRIQKDPSHLMELHMHAKKPRGDKAEKPLCLEQSYHSQACLGYSKQKRCLIG